MYDDTESAGEVVNHAVLGIVDGSLLLVAIIQLFLTFRIDRIDARLKEDERRGLFVDPTVRALYSPVPVMHRKFQLISLLAGILLCARVVDPLAVKYYTIRVTDGLSFNTTACLMLAFSVMIDGALRIMNSLHDQQNSPTVTRAFAAINVFTFIGCNICVAIRATLPAESSYWGYISYLYYLWVVQSILICIWNVSSRRIYKAIVLAQGTNRFLASKTRIQRPPDSRGSVSAGGAALAVAESRDDLLAQPTPETSERRPVLSPTQEADEGTAATDSRQPILTHPQSRTEAKVAALRVTVPEEIPLSSCMSPSASFQRIDIAEPKRAIQSPSNRPTVVQSDQSSPRFKDKSKESDIDAALKKLRRFSIMFHVLYLLTSIGELVIASTTVSSKGARLSTGRGKLPDDCVFMYLQTLAVCVFLSYSWHPRTWYMLRSAAPLSSAVSSDPSVRRQPSSEPSHSSSSRRQVSH